MLGSVSRPRCSEIVPSTALLALVAFLVFISHSPVSRRLSTVVDTNAKVAGHELNADPQLQEAEPKTAIAEASAKAEPLAVKAEPLAAKADSPATEEHEDYGPAAELAGPAEFQYRWQAPLKKYCSKACADGHGPGSYQDATFKCAKSFKPRAGQVWDRIKWREADDEAECVRAGLDKPKNVCNEDLCRAEWSSSLPPEVDNRPVPESPWSPAVKDEDWEPCSRFCFDREEDKEVAQMLLDMEVEEEKKRRGGGALSRRLGKQHESFEGDLHADEDNLPVMKREIYCMLEKGPGNWTSVVDSHCVQLRQDIDHSEMPRRSRPCNPLPPLCSQTIGDFIPKIPGVAIGSGSDARLMELESAVLNGAMMSNPGVAVPAAVVRNMHVGPPTIANCRWLACAIDGDQLKVVDLAVVMNLDRELHVGVLASKAIAGYEEIVAMRRKPAAEWSKEDFQSELDDVLAKMQTVEEVALSPSDPGFGVTDLMYRMIQVDEKPDLPIPTDEESDSPISRTSSTTTALQTTTIASALPDTDMDWSGSYMSSYGGVNTVTQTGKSVTVTNPAAKWSPGTGTVSGNTITMNNIDGTLSDGVITWSNGATWTLQTAENSGLGARHRSPITKVIVVAAVGLSLAVSMISVRIVWQLMSGKMQS